MALRFRRSKRLGPFRLTLGKHGVSVSAGAGRVRVSRGSDGRWRRSIRLLRGVTDVAEIRGRR